MENSDIIYVTFILFITSAQHLMTPSIFISFLVFPYIYYTQLYFSFFIHSLVCPNMSDCTNYNIIPFVLCIPYQLVQTYIKCTLKSRESFKLIYKECLKSHKHFDSLSTNHMNSFIQGIIDKKRKNCTGPDHEH